MEIWKTIKDFENYSVSTLGNVRNDKTKRILKTGDTSGYLHIVLCKNNKKTSCHIHRLLAKTFLENPENKECVDHIDGNRLNNNIENLRYATKSENNRNSNLSRKNTSGIKGLSFNKAANKWEVYISHNNKKIHLGVFENKEDAIKIRKTKANELFGEFVHKIEKLKSTIEQAKEEFIALNEEFERLFGN